jgi:hypothetical protein
LDSGGRAGAVSFATFWHGPLDPTAYTCLASLAALDIDLQVFTYDPDLELPPGVERSDARRIVSDQSLVSRFFFGGKPVISKFSNLFRYRLIAEIGRCWVDTDMLGLRAPIVAPDAVVLGRQEDLDHPHAFNTAVLRLPDGPVLRALIDGAEQSIDKDEPWGTTGPALFTRLVKAHALEAAAAPVRAFYPVAWDRFYMPLLPAYRETVEELTADATFLHLWNAVLARSGYDVFAGPPVGSFLHDAFSQLGTLSRFRRVYEEAELATLLEPWARRG